MEILRGVQMGDFKLDIKNLKKAYSGKLVLDNLSFTVNEGEFLTILGPSGCGKTTILRILVGLLPCDEGTVLKDGADITNLPASKRKMGIVFQNYALFQNMTVKKNITYALKFNEERRADADKIAEDLMAQLGLADHKDKKPNKLSGGQQQRVAIARTLAMSPDIILLDEPLSALDAATRLTLREELKRIQREFNTTMIYITHDQEEAFSMSDRIMVMDRGQISQLDTPDVILTNPANGYVKEFVLDNLKLKSETLKKFVDKL